MKCKRSVCVNCGACSEQPVSGKISDLAPDFANGIESFSVACDLGTTTIACYAVSHGNVIGAISDRNPQVRWGADVISRINHAIQAPSHIEEMKTAVLSKIEDLVARLAERYELSAFDCNSLVVAGNSAMEHIFLGINPISLAFAPFEIECNYPEAQTAQQLGLAGFLAETPVYVFPMIGGFVGGDTTALLFEINKGSADIEPNETKLTIDFGTNGEIALIHSGKIEACSTAAGPAFEGACIRQGKIAASGAISSVRWENGKIAFDTIANGEPDGICGTGLLDAVAVMYEYGVISDSGRIEKGHPLVKGVNKDTRITICEDKDISIYQQDIREFQLAKAAVQTGADILLSKSEIGWDAIDEVILAGAFGSAMNPESLCKTGVLPSSVLSKIRAAGNAAGLGAVRFINSGSAFETADKLVKMTNHVKLESEPDFQERFVEALSLKR